ncbi:MAG: hypothetical protein IPO26_16320 [Saprospiraceae bacterium]|nr:hypothetical protein [Saprospiraceae bacterium]
MNTSKITYVFDCCIDIFIGLPIRMSPFSIIREDGVSVARQSAFAPSIFPEATAHLILLIKFSSTLPALFDRQVSFHKIYKAMTERIAVIVTFAIPMIPPDAMMSIIFVMVA